jgi:hypothetical protein
MELIRESINFQRGLSDEGIKISLFGFRVGQIIIQKASPGGSRRQLSSVFVIEHIVESELPSISLTIMGLGYIYNFQYSEIGIYFEFTKGLSTTTGDPDDFRALTEHEIQMIKEAIKNKPSDFEDKKKWFDIRTGEVGKKILLKESQNFERGLSTREIKDKLVGFRPGQLFTYDLPYSDKKPYREVYMFVKKINKENEDGTSIIAGYVGALSCRDGKVNQFLIRHKKILGLIPLWQEEKRGLTEEEMEKVRKTFKEIPEYFKKIKDDIGILPSLQ